MVTQEIRKYKMCFTQTMPLNDVFFPIDEQSLSLVLS